MKNAIICMLGIFSLLAHGCVWSNENPGSDYSQTQNAAPVFPYVDPIPPPGILLGSQYVSALSEVCYEAYQDKQPSSRPQAYCLRDGKWILLPQIYMIIPQTESSAKPVEQ